MLGVHDNTVYSIVNTFHRNGNRPIEKARPGRPRRNVPDEVIHAIKHRLYEWRFLSLNHRLQIIESEYGFKMSKPLLLTLYRRHGIKFKTAEYAYKRALREHQSIDRERIQFARALGTLIKNHAPIIYMDETSVNLWQPAHSQKTWMSDEAPIQAEINSRRLSSITIYGAIANFRSRPVFMVAKSTNKRDFHKFLGVLMHEFDNPLRDKPYLCLDNHVVHRARFVQRRLTESFIPLF